MSEEVKKSNLTDWDSVDNRRKNSKTNFLRLKTGNTYNVRLFHKPKEIWRYYVNGKSAITADPDNCPVAIKHGPKVKPKLRYAINVIDRADGQVKVMEAPAMVFREFRKFYEANQIDPGGNDAPDFSIKVEGSGLDTKYSVMPKMQPKPFTAEEKALLKSSRYDLDELFPPTDPAKIEEVLGLTGGGTADSGEPEAEIAEDQPAAPAAKPQQTGNAKKSGDFDWA